MRMKCPSSYLLIDFNLKSILLDIRIATPACFLGPFDWKIFSQPFTLRECLSLRWRCVSCMQQKDGSCFHIHSVSVCLFIGELSPLILRNINDQWLINLVIFLVVVCVFCWCEVICIICFHGCSSFLALDFSF